MRVVAILMVVAVVYLILSRNSPVGTAVEAVKEADAVALSTGPKAPPTAMPPATAAAPSSSGLRSPIDRTHSALDQVKQRNGAGEF
jgi:hypothetical protein